MDSEMKVFKIYIFQLKIDGSMMTLDTEFHE